jgi:hypothetical protein
MRLTPVIEAAGTSLPVMKQHWQKADEKSCNDES